MFTAEKEWSRKKEHNEGTSDIVFGADFLNGGALCLPPSLAAPFPGALFACSAEVLWWSCWILCSPPLLLPPRPCTLTPWTPLPTAHVGPPPLTTEADTSEQPSSLEWFLSLVWGTKLTYFNCLPSFLWLTDFSDGLLTVCGPQGCHLTSAWGQFCAHI